MLIEENDLVQIGIQAVLSGARIAETSSNNTILAKKGSLRDIVTRVDLEISSLLTSQFRSNGWSVISEEECFSGELPNKVWVIDPIDGTANFASGIPIYAVSAGWLEGGKPLLGFICAPALNELYATLSSNLACLNGRPIKHQHETEENSLTAISLAAKSGSDKYSLFKDVNESTRGCLRTGSAALNLSWTASNRLQACFGFGAKVWDVAAGLALNYAAGSRVEMLWHEGEKTLDYCVGSEEVVGHIIDQAKVRGLWR